MNRNNASNGVSALLGPAPGNQRILQDGVKTISLLNSVPRFQTILC